MNTPICDFVSRYAQSGAQRLHMPGHKGSGALGVEALDITEITGADSLYEAEGIIRESEENASALFGCPTFYSTEGSSQCIRAMLYLAMLHAKAQGRKFVVAAGRNAHKTFLSGAALLDIEVQWLYAGSQQDYLSCPLTAADVADQLEEGVTAVYLTAPDYLGCLPELSSIAAACHQKDALLLVDNAHGAYLRFLKPSRHPMDLGADLCCASAHKTLPVLTGGAYLHVADAALAAEAKNALALFGSTSPSYLILQSLDRANRILAEGFSALLQRAAAEAADHRAALEAAGYLFLGEEPMKWTICAKAYGYPGFGLAEALRQKGFECEFADPDHLVLMLSPALSIGSLRDALLAIPRLPAILEKPPIFSKAERVLSVREAMLSCHETLPAEACLGRILAAPGVGCPPAVPILICGERIDENALACFRYYGIEKCTVVI
ncbi:MAG: aminotransferase class V-fold PLP-dependent enzyme [Clostridia bacterium]|nr:aminotransferase class V-fold PLP-dependent enzyme [Clostridia bacterium]